MLIKLAHRRAIRRALTGLSLSVTLTSAMAGPLEVSGLRVYRDGTVSDWLAGNHLWLSDGFDDGNPLLGPNFVGSTPASYSLQGLDNPAHAGLALAEHDSALWLNPEYGALSANAAGGVAHSLRLRLLTNTVDANLGFAQSRSFAATLALPLSSLPAPGQTVGLRLTDNFSDNSDVIELYLSHGASGLGVSFREQNFVAGTVTPLGFAALAAPAGASSVVLALSHNSVNSDLIFGSYAYAASDGSLLSAFSSFAAPATAFHGEDHTRLELRVTQAVPEPATGLLFVAGLLGLQGWKRRQRRR